jgi:hypothetical protein
MPATVEIVLEVNDRGAIRALERTERGMQAVARASTQTSQQSRLAVEQLAQAQVKLERAFLSGRISAQQYSNAQNQLRVMQRLANAEIAITPQNLARARAQMELAAASTLKLSSAQRQAAQQLSLLGSQIGIALPRSIQNLIVRSNALSSVIQFLFGASVIGFAVSAIVPLLGRLKEWSEALAGLTQAHKDLEKAAIEASNTVLTGFGSAQLGRQLLSETNRRIEALEQQKVLLQRFSSEIAPSQRQFTKIEEELAKLEALRAEQLKRLNEVQQQETENMKKAAEQAARLRDELEKLIRKRDELAEKLRKEFTGGGELFPITRELERPEGFVLDLRQTRALFAQASQQRVSLEQQAMDQIAAQERELQLLRLELTGDFVGKVILEEQKRVEETLRAAQLIGASEEELARLREILNEQTNLRILQAQREAAREITAEQRAAVADLATQLEALFSGLAGGPMEFFKRLWRRMVFEMVASWLLGLRQMQSAAGGFFGLGGRGGFNFLNLFGLSGFGLGVGPGGTPPFNPAALPLAPATSSRLLSLAPQNLPEAPSALGQPILSGGAGAVLATTPALAGQRTGIAQASALTRFLPLLGLAGSALLGTQNRFLRAAGGFLLGGTLGSILSSQVGLSLGAFGAFLGPIGAIAGLLLGLFGLGGSTRKARLEIERQVKEQVAAVVDAFRFHKIDFLSARSQLEQIRQQGVDALRRAGVKDVQRARRGHVDQWVDKGIAEINRIEEQRQIRSQLAAGSLVPEFQTGGFVRAVHSPGGRILAVLHDREAVLNAGARRLLGDSFIAAVNRAGQNSNLALPTLENGGLIGSAASLPGVLRIEKIELNFSNVKKEDAKQIAAEVILELNRRLARQGIPLRF